MREGIGPLGCDVQELNATECINLEPSLKGDKVSFAGGLYTSSDSSGDIRAFTLAIKDRAQNMGVQFLFNTKVQKLVLNENSNRVIGVKTEVRSFISVRRYSECLTFLLRAEILLRPTR
jgi:D-amino-acid dehydrogenase